MEIKNFDKKTIYIFRIFHDKRIKYLEYYLFDLKSKKFKKRKCNVYTFSIFAKENKFDIFAGKIVGNKLINSVKVVPCIENNLPNITIVDGVGSDDLLNYAIENKFDYKANLY